MIWVTENGEHAYKAAVTIELDMNDSNEVSDRELNVSFRQQIITTDNDFCNAIQASYGPSLP